MNGINMMNSTFFIPTQNYTSCLILPRRNKALRNLPSINTFISTVRTKETLGLVPIRKLFLSKRPKQMSKSHAKNISFLDKISRNVKEIKKKKKEERVFDYKLLMKRYQKYKQKCDKRENLIQIYRNDLSQMPNDYNRALRLNQLIEENETNQTKKDKKYKEDENNNLIATKNNNNNVDGNNEERGDNDDDAIEKENGDDEEEMKKMIEYISTFDYNQYIKNKEIREALRLLKNKMDQDLISAPMSRGINNDSDNIEGNENDNKELLNQSQMIDKEEEPIAKEKELNKGKGKVKSDIIEEVKPIINEEEEKKMENIEQYHLIQKISKKVKVRVVLFKNILHLTIEIE